MIFNDDKIFGIEFESLRQLHNFKPEKLGFFIFLHYNIDIKQSGGNVCHITDIATMMVLHHINK